MFIETELEKARLILDNIIILNISVCSLYTIIGKDNWPKLTNKECLILSKKNYFFL